MLDLSPETFALPGEQDMLNDISAVISYVFGFYMLSYALDLLPAVKTRSHIPQGYRLRPEMSERRLESQEDPHY